MPRLEEIEARLPWGLHDAVLESLTIDFANSTLTLDLRLMMTERQEMDQRARVRVRGVAWIIVEPPMPPAVQRESPISAGPVAAGDERWPELPPVPSGCFAYWLFLQDWDSFIFFAGRDATLEWVEPKPVPSRPIAPPSK